MTGSLVKPQKSLFLILSNTEYKAEGAPDHLFGDSILEVGSQWAEKCPPCTSSGRALACRSPSVRVRACRRAVNGFPVHVVHMQIGQLRAIRPSQVQVKFQLEFKSTREGPASIGRHLPLRAQTSAPQSAYAGRAPECACMHVCMYACTHACMHACMHVRMLACMHACTG